MYQVLLVDISYKTITMVEVFAARASDRGGGPTQTGAPKQRST